MRFATLFSCLTKKGLVLIVVSAILATTCLGALIYLFTEYDGQQIKIITLEGNEPILYVDGVGLITQSFIIPEDNFSDGVLTAGETETFSHTVESLQGNWEIGFVVPNYTETEHPLYGYECHILDSLNNDITTTGLMVLEGEIKIFKIKHSLNENWFDDGSEVSFVMDINFDKIIVIMTEHYKLDGNANDEINSHNGTASGITWVIGKDGSGADFNGVDGMIEMP